MKFTSTFKFDTHKMDTPHWLLLLIVKASNFQWF